MADYSRRRLLAVAAGAGTLGIAGCLDFFDDEAVPEGEPIVGGTQGGAEFFNHDVRLQREYSAFADTATSGGVGQDGIPSIDDPVFEDVSYGDSNMDDGDPVFGVEMDGEARAYPQYILVRHEIVNDELAGQNIAVTYCPLTGTAVGFHRDEDEFGVSGMLVNSNLIMYDRVSESWWPQVLGTLVRGDDDTDVLGRSLAEFRVTWTTWGRWKDVYPDTEVLSEETGQAFAYVDDPYGEYNPREGYYTSDNLMFDVMHEDDSHPPKEVFVGARSRDGKVAFRKDLLRDEPLVETTVGGVSYLAAYHHDLDSVWIYRNPADDTYAPADTGYEGPDGVQYSADELPLEEINAFDAMWFAWVAFYPETVVVA